MLRCNIFAEMLQHNAREQTIEMLRKLVVLYNVLVVVSHLPNKGHKRAHCLWIASAGALAVYFLCSFLLNSARNFIHAYRSLVHCYHNLAVSWAEC